MSSLDSNELQNSPPFFTTEHSTRSSNYVTLTDPQVNKTVNNPTNLRTKLTALFDRAMRPKPRFSELDSGLNRASAIYEYGIIDSLGFFLFSSALLANCSKKRIN